MRATSRPRPHGWWVPRALLALAVAGCSEAPGTASSAPDAPSWEVELIHEIGSLDDVEQALTAVGDVAIGPRGRLYVGQRVDGYVRVHAADGTFDGTIGRRGEGPGEFQSVGSISIDSTGLWVFDSGNQRMSRFDLDGTLVDEERWPTARLGEGLATMIYRGAVRAPDGSVLAFPGLIVPGPGTGGPPAELRAGVPVRTLRADGVLGDTVVLLPSPFMVQTPEGMLSGIQTGPALEHTRDGRRLLWVERDPAGNPEPGTFRVMSVAADGDTVFDRTWAYAPMPAPVAEIRAEREATLSDRVRDAYTGGVWVPETMPAVSAVVAAQSGLIWLAREERRDPRTWWVLDGDSGEQVARLDLPPDEEVVDQRDDVLVTKRADEFGVEYLRRYRILR